VLSDKGYTPVEGNLNDGGKTYAMMGYKTTDDIRDSITDLAVMNMDGKYSTTEYSEVLKAKEQKVAEMLTDFMAAIREYRVNLKAGKEKAKVIRGILNKLTDDDTGMKMGDLLNSETLQDKVGIKQSINHQNPDKLPDLLTIFMQGNSYLITMIETLLAISADTADNTWIDRFSELDTTLCSISLKIPAPTSTPIQSACSISITNTALSFLSCLPRSHSFVPI